MGRSPFDPPPLGTLVYLSIDKEDPVSRWKHRVLERIRELIRLGFVRFTQKALRELAQLGLSVHDALEILAELTVSDLADRKLSQVTGEWLYVFHPQLLDGTILYVKIILREGVYRGVVPRAERQR